MCHFSTPRLVAKRIFICPELGHGDAIRDCDIRFYGANSNGTIDWNIDPNGAPDGGHAVRHTLVHELGHCLGISHSELQDALMYAYAPADQGPGC